MQVQEQQEQEWEQAAHPLHTAVGMTTSSRQVGHQVRNAPLTTACVGRRCSWCFASAAGQWTELSAIGVDVNRQWTMQPKD